LKYGRSKFKLQILEYCSPEVLLKIEQYYIILLKPEYNILQEAGSRMGFKHVAETKAKMSEAKKGNKNPFFCKTHTQETKAKLRAAALGRKLSEDTKAKMSEAKKGNKNMSEANGTAVEVLDLETNVKQTFFSIRMAAIAVGVAHSTVLRYLTAGVPYKDRYVFITKSYKR
jgi:group I intron endonuclease